jgi:hypothetical protein
LLGRLLIFCHLCAFAPWREILLLASWREI